MYFLSLISLILFAFNIEAKMLICLVEKVAYVDIRSPRFTDKQLSDLKLRTETNFKLYDKTGESYILMLSDSDMLAGYDIYYQSKKSPEMNWNLLERVKKDKQEIQILNKENPMIIRLLGSSFMPTFDYETIYYLNTDKNEKSTLSIVHTYWNGPFANNQSLTYAPCE